MKRLWGLTILMIILTGCGKSTPPIGSGQCKETLCVKIEVDEPIHWGEPVAVTVIVTAKRDITDLQVSLTSYPPASIENQGEWVEEGTRVNVNLAANQPLVLVHKVRLPGEGIFELKAGAYAPSLPYVSDSVRIYLHSKKGDVYHLGTSIPVTPPPLLVYTVTPGPSPTLLPTDTPWATLPPTYVPPERALTQVPYPNPAACPPSPLLMPTRDTYP